MKLEHTPAMLAIWMLPMAALVPATAKTPQEATAKIEMKETVF